MTMESGRPNVLNEQRADEWSRLIEKGFITIPLQTSSMLNAI